MKRETLTGTLLLAFAAGLVASIPAARAGDGPSLGSTLLWLQNKLRDRSEVRVNRVDENSTQMYFRESSSLTYQESSCLATLSVSVSNSSSRGGSYPITMNWRIPLAELDPASTTVSQTECMDLPSGETLLPGNSNRCYQVTLGSSRPVLKQLDGSSQTRRLTILLPGTEGDVASKMRDGFAYAIKLCQDDDPQFPKVGSLFGPKRKPLGPDALAIEDGRDAKSLGHDDVGQRARAVNVAGKIAI